MVIFNSYVSLPEGVVEIHGNIIWNILLDIPWIGHLQKKHRKTTCRTSGSYTHLIFVKQKLGRSAFSLHSHIPDIIISHCCWPRIIPPKNIPTIFHLQYHFRSVAISTTVIGATYHKGLCFWARFQGISPQNTTKYGLIWYRVPPF